MYPRFVLETFCVFLCFLVICRIKPRNKEKHGKETRKTGNLYVHMLYNEVTRKEFFLIELLTLLLTASIWSNCVLSLKNFIPYRLRQNFWKLVGIDSSNYANKENHLYRITPISLFQFRPSMNLTCRNSFFIDYKTTVLKIDGELLKLLVSVTDVSLI